ncbi:hypothetical protein RRG08_017513 [Elysia crispata]|uniref:Uncharacterized protein n=1 Tax=Elysia crispata TaxID=231223 RepID=A0AAE0Y068_9GAST|nr:hypothetical protein RRG08_017513 [Elysia crispata]
MNGYQIPAILHIYTLHLHSKSILYLHLNATTALFILTPQLHSTSAFYNYTHHLQCTTSLHIYTPHLHSEFSQHMDTPHVTPHVFTLCQILFQHSTLHFAFTSVSQDSEELNTKRVSTQTSTAEPRWTQCPDSKASICATRQVLFPERNDTSPRHPRPEETGSDGSVLFL